MNLLGGVMDELESENRPQSRVSRGLKWLGGNLRPEVKRAMYGMHAPKGTYPTNSDAAHIHLNQLSRDKVRRAFGFGHKEEMAVGALHSDTKSGLVKELIDSGLDRRAAEQTVNSLIQRGIFQEVDDPDLGKILVYRGG